jgi:hypothetical protein
MSERNFGSRDFNIESNGVAMNIEEYAPVKRPTNRANANS